MATIRKNNNVLNVEADSDERWSCTVINGNFKLSKYYGFGNTSLDIIVPPYIYPFGWVEINSTQSFCNKPDRVFINDCDGTDNKLWLYAEPDIIVLDSDDDVKDLKITSNIEWEILWYDSKVSLTSNKGEGDATIGVGSNYKGNFDYIPLYITSSLGVEEILVKKEIKQKNMLSVTPTEVNLDYNNNKFNATIVSIHEGKETKYSISTGDKIKLVYDDGHGNVKFEIIDKSADFKGYPINITNCDGNVKIIVNFVSIVNNDDTFVLTKYNGNNLGDNVTNYNVIFDKDNFEKTHEFKVKSTNNDTYVNWWVEEKDSEVDANKINSNTLILSLNEADNTVENGMIVLKNNLNRIITISYQVGDGLIENDEYVIGFGISNIVTEKTIDYPCSDLVLTSKKSNTPIPWKPINNGFGKVKYDVMSYESGEWVSIFGSYHPESLYVNLIIGNEEPKRQDCIWIKPTNIDDVGELSGIPNNIIKFQQIRGNFLEAKLTIKYPNSIGECNLYCDNKEFLITSKQDLVYVLKADRKEYKVDSSKNSLIDIIIDESTKNGKYTEVLCSEECNWVSVKSINESGVGAVIKCETEPNSSKSERSCSLKVYQSDSKSTASPVTITITQGKSTTKECELKLVDGSNGISPYYPANSSSESFYYTVRSVCDGEYAKVKLENNGNYWCSMTSDEYLTEFEHRIHFRIAENFSNSQREGVFNIKQIDGNAPPIKITINQSGKNM